MFARLFVKSFAAFTYLGGLALIVAGIVNIVHLHDRAGGTTVIVLGSLFMLAWAAESWTGGPYAARRVVTARRGSTPKDTDLIKAMAMLREEEATRPYGAKRRAARRLHIDIATLYRWRRLYEARGLGEERAR